MGMPNVSMGGGGDNQANQSLTNQPGGISQQQQQPALNSMVSMASSQPNSLSMAGNSDMMVPAVGQMSSQQQPQPQPPPGMKTQQGGQQQQQQGTAGQGVSQEEMERRANLVSEDVQGQLTLCSLGIGAVNT